MCAFLSRNPCRAGPCMPHFKNILAPPLTLTLTLTLIQLVSLVFFLIFDHFRLIQSLSAMDDDVSFRRVSSRTRKFASKMVAALTSSDNRTQNALARLEALENDNAGAEIVEINDDDDASLDDDDQGYTQKRQSKNTKRKTRQAKALENAKKAPRTFMELLHEANLESLPPHVPTYLTAAVGPPSSSSRRHFCTVCGFTANYTCVRCGMRFCSCRCQVIHTDTRCLKFVS